MNNKLFGNQGEQFVLDYLTKKGFRIAAVNYRQFFGEIDIIAYKPQLYIFVEVKSRRSQAIPMTQLISSAKQKKIIKTAQTFIAENKLSNSTFRFDVALVWPTDNGFDLNYIENAFIQQESEYGNQSY